MNADRDPNLDALIDSEARGGSAPYGYRVERPSQGLTPLTHNPYFNVPLGLVQIGLGAFLLEKSGLALWGWICVVLFGLFGVIVVAFAIWRIPSWHRARRTAREYIAAHGGRMPPELRWYT